MSNNFEIIYKKLEEEKLSSQPNEDVLVVNNGDASSEEIDEINELRKIILEINESEPCTYTSS